MTIAGDYIFISVLTNILFSGVFMYRIINCKDVIFVSQSVMCINSICGLALKSVFLRIFENESGSRNEVQALHVHCSLRQRSDLIYFYLQYVSCHFDTTIPS
jgi:hypothetical protein